MRLTTKALLYQVPVKKVRTTTPRNDLHVLKDDASSADPGIASRREGIGIVDKVGSGVTAFHPGDRVIVSCVSSCGKCEYCRKGMYSHCADGLVWRAI
jgi:alcohol dehydrogenase